MQIENLIGISAGILTAVAMMPQLVKVLRDKKADDISPLMIVLLLVGLGLWIAYGAIKKDLPILLTNSFSVLVNLVLLVSCIWFKKERK